MADEISTALPHSAEAEQSVIGAVLINPDLYHRLRTFLKPEHFYVHRNRFIWEALHSLYMQRCAVDTLTLSHELETAGHLEEIGGSAYLTGLIAATPSSLNAESYGRIVEGHFIRREMIKLANKIAQRAYDEGWPIEKSISIIKTELTRVERSDQAGHTITLGGAMSEVYDRVGLAAEGKLRVVKTDYVDLDKMLGGLSAPDLYLIAGRPGQGKTAFLGSIGRNTALALNRVGIFTLEMSNLQFAMRLTAMETGIPFDRLKSGALEEREWPILTNAVERLAEPSLYPIMLNDLASIRISQMRIEAERMADTMNGLDLIMMDYVQLGGNDEQHDRRDLEVGEISRGLKALAKEFNVPVLAAAQLSRAVEQRSDHRPVLSDLRESGSLENDADVVMFIYRPDQYERNTDKHNIAEIIVSKHRNGPVGSVELVYRPHLTRFESVAPRYQREDYTNH